MTEQSQRAPKPPFSWPGDDEAERECLERIAELEQEFRHRAQPYINILTAIAARKPPNPVFIPFDELPSHAQENLRRNAENVLGPLRN